MYSGSTIRKNSGNVIGIHQRIDRVARKNLKRITDKNNFPNIKSILHFEGNNGPDSIKYTTMSNDKPLHFINEDDSETLFSMVNNHSVNLSDALRQNDLIRASFEASWMAHAITDGLTPAHHFPLTGKVKELWGKSRNEFNSLKEKSLIKGENPRDTITKNWEYWGAGGVMTSHVMYELGVALSMLPSFYKHSCPNQNELIITMKNGFESVYKNSVEKIIEMDMYEKYKKSGWTRELADKTRTILLPEIIKLVTLAWYESYENSKRGSSEN